MDRRNGEKKQVASSKKSTEIYADANGEEKLGKARPAIGKLSFQKDLTRPSRSFIYLLRGMRGHVRDRNEIFNK